MTTSSPTTAPTLADHRERLPELMLRDRVRLERRIERASRASGASAPAPADLTDEVDAALRRVLRRRERVPRPRYPEDLPVSLRKDEIADAIRDHQVVVVAGETGSGKSTQLPKICLDVGRGVHGLIGHTQPRRLAARSVAERVAEELDGSVGGAVGYTVRFTDRVGDDTYVKVMTDGILLADIQRDPLLSAYDTVIVDEAHERSLNIDFILGYLKQLLPRRPDLKVVITSATIDTARFSEHFDGAPVVEISGRSYPVEVRYRPVADDSDDDGGRDQVQAICDAVEELAAEGPGDILVFLSGEREIRDAADAVDALGLPHTHVLPLYARLTAAEQHRVFEPHTGRRVVLATNVAETSLTVPGVRYVVDPGTARISRYSRRTKVQRLPIEPVSQASANQRAGRCGRVAPGICIRLYDEEDLVGRPEFTDPEILRTNLASVILQMTALGLGEMEAFPFVEPPDRRAVRDGVALLEELGALEPAAEGSPPRLTPIGRRLAQLPLDPRLGRMVLEAERHDCVHEVMVIAAALSIQDPRERPRDEKRQAAAELHGRFTDPASDFLAYLNLWEHLRAQRRELSSNQFRRRCRAEFLHYLRVREWQDIYSQLLTVCRRLGIHVNRDRARDDDIHLSLLAGLLSQIGMRADSERDYRGARNTRFALSSGSALAKKPPRWVMAGELVETSRLWAHVAARIQPEWVERVGAHLVQRTYSDPRWDRSRGAVMAQERVTLHGLPIVTGRPVNYAKVDPAGARELFIRHALVEGDWDTHHAFLRQNEEVAAEIRTLEDRVRRRDLLVDDETLFELYDARIPTDVTSARHFDRWWKGQQHSTPGLLELSTAQLLDERAGDVVAGDFPDVWRHGDLELPLTYEFDPASPTDGVTAHVPLAAVDRLSEARLDWHVPGLRHELVTALIRSLPKALRRNLVPAPDQARAAVARIGPADGPLLETLSRDLGRVAGETIPLDGWQLSYLPDHLRVTYRVEDQQGRPLAVGKDLTEITRRLWQQRREAVQRAGARFEQSGLEAWPVDGLAREVEVVWAGHRVEAYPALVDEGSDVAVRVLPTRGEQERAMWGGTRRLLLLSVPSPRRALRDRLTTTTKIALGYAPHAGPAELLDDCITCAVDQLLGRHGGPVWDEAAFGELRESVRRDLPDTTVGVVAAAGRILQSAKEIDERLGQLGSPVLLAAVTDIHVQLSRLVYPGFVTATGARRLPDVMRYVRAIERRIDRLPEDPARDRRHLDRIRVLEDALVGVRRAEDVTRIRWMIEELRVSYYAQQLGTAHRVSEERVRREIEEASR